MKKKSILLGKSKRVKRKFQGLNLLLELLNSIKVSGNWGFPKHSKTQTVGNAGGGGF